MFTERDVDDADHAALWALHVETMRDYVDKTYGWEDTDQHNRFAAHFLDLIQNGGRVVVDDDGIVASYRVERREERLVLASIEVAARAQGRGVGTSIVNRLLEEGERRSLPVDLAVMKANPRALALYRRLAFNIVRETATHFFMRAGGRPWARIVIVASGSLGAALMDDVLRGEPRSTTPWLMPWRVGRAVDAEVIVDFDARASSLELAQAMSGASLLAIDGLRSHDVLRLPLALARSAAIPVAILAAGDSEERELRAAISEAGGDGDDAFTFRLASTWTRLHPALDQLADTTAPRPLPDDALISGVLTDVDAGFGGHCFTGRCVVEAVAHGRTLKLKRPTLAPASSSIVLLTATRDYLVRRVVTP